MNRKIEQTIENLTSNKFTVKYFASTHEAREALLTEIKESESVGFGSSMTLMGMGMKEALEERGNQVYYHGTAKDPEDKKFQLKNAAVADVYLSGTNAVTKDGRLVNIDGTGNRLSGILFGHQRVYIVVGVNKIVDNLEEALIRIKNQACPQNTERLGLDTPCRVKGKCENCDSPQRICNATLIIDKKMSGADMSVYIIGENLGY